MEEIRMTLRCGEKIKDQKIEILKTTWRNREKDNGRHEVLSLKINGERNAIPITKIDSPDFGDIWNADWVYSFEDLLCVEKFDEETGKIHTIEYSLNDEDKLEHEREYTSTEDNPGKDSIASKVIWKRE